MYIRRECIYFQKTTKKLNYFKATNKRCNLNVCSITQWTMFPQICNKDVDL